MAASSSHAPLRVGIVGASPDRGWALTAHQPALAALPQYAIVAVATSRRQSAERAAEVYKASHWFDDAQTLIAQADVDLITVAVKVPDHAAIVRAALKARRHVYCEWPLARSRQESVALLREARAAGVHDAIGLQARSSATLEHVRELIANGYVGRVRSATVHAALPFGSSGLVPAASAYSLDPANGASLLRIAGGHTLDALEHLLGPIATVSAVTAEGTRYTIAEEGRTVESTAPTMLSVSAQLRVGGIATVAIEHGRVTNPGLRIVVSGSDGDLLLTASGPRSGVQMAELRACGARRGAGGWDDLRPSMGSGAGVDGALLQPAANVAAAYARLAADIEAGTRTVADFATADRLHRLLDAVEQAAATGTRITP